MIRTDLALEAKELWERSAEKTTCLHGVKACRQGNLTRVDILDSEGAEALGKPVGRYLTLALPAYDRDPRTPAEELAKALGELMNPGTFDRVMVVALGNEAITPDALGPRTGRLIFPTRHLVQTLPGHFGTYRSVSVVTPGVLATTGVETMELVKGAVATVKPEAVICIDALAAGTMDRLCNTIQCCDSGIAPGSGVGNCRKAFSKDSIGVPVYAVGVPTVVDGGTKDPMIVTPRDIDEQIRYLSRVLAGGINRLLHPQMSYDDFVQFVPQ